MIVQHGLSRCLLIHHLFVVFPFSTYYFLAEREVWAWGAPQSIGEDFDDFLIPENLDELILDASAGTDYTLFILSDGSAAVAGNIPEPDDYQGHFACGCQTLMQGANSILPIADVVNLNGDIESSPEWKAVFAGVESSQGSGRMHSIFIDVGGNIYSAGNNNKGQLCLGDGDSRIFPTQIDLPGNEKAVSAAVGGEFTLIFTNSGRVYGCGSNELGQTGLGNTDETDLPQEIDGLSGSVKSLSAGRYFSLIRTDDFLYVMGDNTFGQLCLNSDGDPLRFPAELDISTDSVRQFEAGKDSSYMLLEDGSAIACGLNEFGQLGDGSFDDSFGTEVQFPNSASEVVYVGAGPSAASVFWITVDGTVYGNGLNDRGQLGVGDTFDSTVPVVVDFPNSADVAYISASNTHTVAW
ncbi:hypothetical protein ACHAXR_011428 [Thalassiosira sp. AJA248-18]